MAIGAIACLVLAVPLFAPPVGLLGEGCQKAAEGEAVAAAPARSPARIARAALRPARPATRARVAFRLRPLAARAFASDLAHRNGIGADLRC